MSKEAFSVVDDLLEGTAIELMGEGIMRLQSDQDGLPEGPGRANFGLRYAPQELAPGKSHTHALKLSLSGIDDEGHRILEGRAEEGMVPLARYDLAGTAEVAGNPTSMRLDTIYVDHRTGGSMRALISEDNAHSLTCGDGEGVDLQDLRAIIPNLWAPPVDIVSGGLRLRLEPLVNDMMVADPLYAGKVVPGCLLTLEKLDSTEEIDLLAALDVFGSLLTFYAGRAVSPTAWEGQTAAGPLWGSRAHDVTTLPVQEHRTCLPRSTPVLGAFLSRAWESWQYFDETRQARLRGVARLYQRMLSATYATVTIALTAMYLERFRELVVGSSELLPVGPSFSKSKRDRVASNLRKSLRAAIDENSNLDDDQKAALKTSLAENPAKIQDLFRRSFRESLLELYDRAGLEVDEAELKEFVQERDRTIHGGWDASRAGGMKSHHWSEYGINLIERLVLRFFAYEGEYYNRTTAEVEHFAHRDPDW